MPPRMSCLLIYEQNSEKNSDLKKLIQKLSIYDWIKINRCDLTIPYDQTEPINANRSPVRNKAMGIGINLLFVMMLFARLSPSWA